MLNETNLPKYFWVSDVSITCYVINRVLIIPILNLTPYELYKGRKPNISHWHVFRCKCFILNNGNDNFENFDAKVDDDIFLGFSTAIKAFRIFNKRTHTIKEFVLITFDESNPLSVEVEVVDYEGILEKTFPKDDNQNKNQDQGQEKNQSLNEETQDEEESLENKYLPKEWRISKDHLIHNLFGYISKGVTTRHSLSKVYNHMDFFPNWAK